MPQTLAEKFQQVLPPSILPQENIEEENQSTKRVPLSRVAQASAALPITSDVNLLAG